MVATTGDLLDIVGLELGDDSWFRDHSIVLASTLDNATLAKVVESPSPNAAVFANSEAVVCAGSNLFNLATRKAKFTGNEATSTSALHYSATKLVLLATAPGPNVVFGIKSENVVGAGGQAGDLLQLWDFHRSILHHNLWSEPENTVVALENS